MAIVLQVSIVCKYIMFNLISFKSLYVYVQIRVYGHFLALMHWEFFLTFLMMLPICLNMFILHLKTLHLLH